jgi:hypothetical protein
MRTSHRHVERTMTLWCHLRHEETLSAHVSRPLPCTAAAHLLRSDQQDRERGSFDFKAVERFPNAF